MSERVLIYDTTLRDGTQPDTNIIAASAAALLDSLEYAIWKSGAEPRRRDVLEIPTTVHQTEQPQEDARA